MSEMRKALSGMKKIMKKSETDGCEWGKNDNTNDTVDENELNVEADFSHGGDNSSITSLGGKENRTTVDKI